MSLHLRHALGRNPKVRPCWRHSKQITLLHFATCGSAMSSITFITAENAFSAELQWKDSKDDFCPRDSGLSISTTCRRLLNFLHMFCDYFWQSVKLQMLPVWTIYTANKMANHGYCTTVICSSTLWCRVPSIWRLPGWWHGKPSFLGIFPSCPKVGHLSTHTVFPWP